MLRLLLIATLCLGAIADHNENHAKKSRHRQRERQRNRANNLIAAAQAQQFSSSMWLKVGAGCCRSTDADGSAFANEENVGCDQGGEEDLPTLDRLEVENKGECKLACEEATCCVAFEWRGKSRSGVNCDLFDTTSYPNSCTKEGTTCATGASCWKKNLMVADTSALTSYVKTESDGCCRGASEDSLATIANLPVLDASKRKKHLKKCEEACDLVPECNAIESAFNEIFSGRCDLIAGEVTRADDTTPACRGTGCFTKQCPGDLRALVEQATSAASLGGLGSLLTAGEETTADFESSTGTDHGQQSEEEKNDTGPMILAVAACVIALLVAGMMTIYFMKSNKSTTFGGSQAAPMVATANQSSEVEVDQGTITDHGTTVSSNV